METAEDDKRQHERELQARWNQARQEIEAAERRQEEVVVAAHEAGMSYAAIGAIIGYSPQGVKNIYDRATSGTPAA
jgi:DNA-directed RNA polymerase specialized sigma24 family protein